MGLSRQAAIQRIADQEARIGRQKVLIASLATKGAGVSSAERLLATMEDSLAVLRASLWHFPDRN